eukprot:XP_011421128.1 PREDICTED: uncharacterized protein LOC105323740 [Crassostrea gigas]
MIPAAKSRLRTKPKNALYMYISSCSRCMILKRAVAMAACSGEKMDRLLITLCSFLGVCVLLLVCVLSSLLHKHKYIGGVSKLKDFLCKTIRGRLGKKTKPVVNPTYEEQDLSSTTVIQSRNDHVYLHVDTRS